MNKKIVAICGLVVLAAVLLFVSRVSGVQPNNPKEIKVQIVKVTKTYQDFQNAPLALGIRHLKIVDFPVSAEIFSVYGDIKNVFSPGEGGFVPNVRTASGRDCTGGSLGGVGFSQINLSTPLLVTILCSASEDSALFLDVDDSAISSVAQGSLDVYVSYIVHQ